MSNWENNGAKTLSGGSGLLKRRGAAAIVTAACLAIFSFTACGGLPGGGTSGSADNSGGGSGSETGIGGSGIKTPVVINYIVNNPLDVQEHKEGDGSGFDYTYITVAGLADKTVEQAVNDRIKAVYDGLRAQDLPPYRGIKAKISADDVIAQEQIYANVIGNFNNILSVTFWKNTAYQDPAAAAYTEDDKEYWEQIRYVSEQEALNFDLNTGKEITLKDLFCDDVDYMKLINERMSGYLAKSYSDEEGWYGGLYSGVKLAESFKGLSEDQKFAVSPNGITFVFDYLTPQFETELSAVGPILNFREFGDTVAATVRFYKEGESIFTSEAAPVKSLVYKGNNNDNGGNERYKDGFINVHRSWAYSSALPEEIKHRIGEMTEVDQEAVKRGNAYYSGLSAKELAETSGEGVYEINVSAQMIGGFINVFKYSGLYLYQNSEDTVEGHCYDAGTLTELTLSDIFKEGYDYKPVVMGAIRQAIKDFDEGQGKTGKTYSDAQYEEVFDRIGGIRLDSDSVNADIAHPEEEYSDFYLNLWIPYADFGCENMNIFR
jgi:hypothetical protein